MDANKACDILLPIEGGYVNDPNDPGGETNFGISKRAYPNLDIKNLTEQQARGIYGTDFWLKGNCQKLKPELQYVHFDSCVNLGIERAIKILQEASGLAGAEIDGIFGSQTLMKSDDATIGEYLFLRECYDAEIVEHRQSQIEFLGGWTNRNKNIWNLYKQNKLN